MLQQAKSMLIVLAQEEGIYPGIYQVLGASSFSPDYTEQDYDEIISDLKGAVDGDGFSLLAKGGADNFHHNIEHIKKTIGNYRKELPWWKRLFS